MSKTQQRALLIAVIAAFGAYTGYVIADYGPKGFMEEAVDNMATAQVLIDLTIVATLALIWMFKDSRTSGTPFAPYAVLTFFAGSFGPLGYLLHRTWKTD